MPLNGNTLGDAIKAAVQAIGITDGTPITEGQITAFWRAVGNSDVSHIQGNALVTVPGVQSGPSTATGGVT